MGEPVAVGALGEADVDRLGAMQLGQRGRFGDLAERSPAPAQNERLGSAAEPVEPSPG
jgi:hypothetical protein